MLKFCRNKFVGYEKIADNKFLIQGVLEDNLYAHEVEIVVRVPSGEYPTSEDIDFDGDNDIVWVEE